MTRATNVPGRGGRLKVIIINTGSSDEVLRASVDPDELANSAVIAYNRGKITYTGEHAQREIFLISDTASTPVYYTEVL